VFIRSCVLSGILEAQINGDIPHRSGITMLCVIHSVSLQIHLEVALCFLMLSFAGGRKPRKWRHSTENSSHGLFQVKWESSCC